MTKRLALAIIGIVAATLVLAGLGTFAVSQLRARAVTERDLRGAVEQLAGGLEGVEDPAAQLTLVRRLNRVLQVDDIAVVLVDRNGTVRGQVALPPPVTVADLDRDALLAGDTVGGVRRGTAWAAAGIATGARGQALAAIVATRQVDAGVGAALRWFLLAAAVTLAIGGLLAWWLSRRLTRPVRATSNAAHAIAAGHLDTRLEEPRGDDELADLARSVNTMAASLERSRQLEQRFLMSVSHDLRTPLTSIRGYAEAIGDGAGDPRAHAGVILGEARRLERLVGDLLDLAKLQADEFTLHPERFDLGAVAAETVDGFRPAASDRGVSIDVQAASSAVLADPLRTAQVVANLLDNALRFARARVAIRVEGATVSVDDDGPGIAADDLPHVFERLYTSRREPRRNEASSGLGLAIVRHLVTAMGGTVQAIGSGPLGGATLSVTLPPALTPAS